MKNFCPTKTFLSFLKEKLETFSKENGTNTVNDHIKKIQKFSSLITKIRDKIS
ncbi:hypothetical protein LCGC14_2364340 [marine sediment metagenome]|uniref:Uncharacterized protein n=1 Tax=marine sediment metagenome TaxID=412755 RepID=A0A0F9F0E9_9ZZZZ